MKEYKGIEYQSYVNTDLGHFCGYVKLPPKHPWIKILTKQKKIKLYGGNSLKVRDYDKLPVTCHGGLTFGEYFAKPFNQWTKGWWIGWDYAHAGDAVASLPKNKGDKVWTLEEVEEECKRVINQVLNTC